MMLSKTPLLAPSHIALEGVGGATEQKTGLRVLSGHNSSQKLSFALSAAIEEAVNHQTRVITFVREVM